MFPFLDRVNKAELHQFAAKVCARNEFSLGGVQSRQQIYSILFSLYGFSVLHEKGIRRLLLQTLDEDHIRTLAIHLMIDNEMSRYDTEALICEKRWRPGSAAVNAFAELFDIPPEFLPGVGSKKMPVEVVEPFYGVPPLFDYQNEVIEKTYAELSKDSARSFMIQLPTGAGKTRTIIESLVRFRRESSNEEARKAILWMAHTEELCHQAAEAFRRVWQTMGNQHIRLCRLWGDYRAPIEEFPGSFIVAGYSKLSNLRKRDRKTYNRLQNMVHFLVIDEAHKALAPTICQVIEDFHAGGKHIMGLTATPGRGTESSLENKALAKLFSNTLISSKKLGDNPIVELQEKGILSKLKYIKHDTNTNVSLSRQDEMIAEFAEDLPVNVLKKLARNKKRNNLIASIVSEQLKSQKPTLIFACTVDHAKVLSLSVAAKGHPSAYVDCHMRRGQRESIIEAFRSGTISALFNYGVLSAGFDAPNVRTIVITRPTSSVVLYSQMIGRGLRGPLVGGGEECLLVDLRDNFVNFGAVDSVYNFFEPYWQP